MPQTPTRLCVSYDRPVGSSFRHNSGFHLRQSVAHFSLMAIITNLLLISMSTTISSFAQSQIEVAAQLAPAMLNQAMEIKSQVPVIGILTEVLRDYKRFVPTRQLHIASSYVKWIESAGAQVVPILLNQDDNYYERMFTQTNGLLFPGGDNLLDPSKQTPMMVAAKKLYNLAVAANDRGDHYPIWGTCLGMELLSVLTANRNVLDSCHANDIPLTMEFVARGKLFGPAQYSNLDHLTNDFAKIIMDTLEVKQLTYNYHQMCLTDAGLSRAGLDKFYRPLSYSVDRRGFKFIAIFEAIAYPFYGVQFHPEKAPFEFVVKRSQQNVPHSRESIAVSRYFADFFITQAQLNAHQIDREQLSNELIYAHDPLYTAPKNDMYEQRYLFAYGGKSVDSTSAGGDGGSQNAITIEVAGLKSQLAQLATNQTNLATLSMSNKLVSSEEFLDYVPSSDEEVSEQVSLTGKLGR